MSNQNRQNGSRRNNVQRNNPEEVNPPDINLKEEAFKPIQAFMGKQKKKIVASPYKNFFYALIIIVTIMVFGANTLVFYNDTISAYQDTFRPEEENKQQEQIIQLETENEFLKGQIKQYEKDEDSMRNQYNLLQNENIDLKVENGILKNNQNEQEKDLSTN